MKRLLIYAVFFIALFGGLMATMGVPGYIAVGTEALISLLLVVSLITRMGRGISVPHLWYSFFYMILICACSIAVNDSGITRAIFSLRVLFRYYLFYLAITLLAFDDSNLRKINRFVAILLLLQLPVVAIKFNLYGISEETQGAYTRDGAMTTMIPVVFIFYLAAYYYLYRPKILYILAGIAVVIWSIVGAKRAVFFLYPFQFLAIYYYIYIKGKGGRFSKKVGVLILTLPLIAVVSGSILYFNKSLNPERKVGGSLDLKYALDYAEKYNIGVDGYGYSYGRVATTIRVSEKMWNSGLARLFFGFGPGSTTRSILSSREERKNFRDFFVELKIGYGLTAMSRIALEYGVLGVVAYSLMIFLLARMCLKYYKYENDPYWRAFAAGSVGFAFSILFFFFTYGDTSIWGDTLPALYFYAMAVVYTRLKRTRVNTVETKHLT